MGIETAPAAAAAARIARARSILLCGEGRFVICARFPAEIFCRKRKKRAFPNFLLPSSRPRTTEAKRMSGSLVKFDQPTVIKSKSGAPGGGRAVAGAATLERGGARDGCAARRNRATAHVDDAGQPALGAAHLLEPRDADGRFEPQGAFPADHRGICTCVSHSGNPVISTVAYCGRIDDLFFFATVATGTSRKRGWTRRVGMARNAQRSHSRPPCGRIRS
jgi:hypothetical protein